MDFETAFQKLLGHEGRYSNNPDDPGGATMWGITERVARLAGYKGDMRDMTLQIAKAIARIEYWDRVRADDMPAALRYPLFDAAYNSGVRQSVIWLQRALGVTPDGVIGQQTLKAVLASNPIELRQRMLSQRLRFMTDLKNWPTFSRGWARRIADLMEQA